MVLSAPVHGAAVPTDKLEPLEIELLLEAIRRQYGHDFRGYARASLKRRLGSLLFAEGLSTLSALQERVLHQPGCIERLVMAVSVNVTSFYRDPGFFRAFRQQIAPMLRTYPFVRLWHAGCSTGEEVYSMAILLQEEGLYDRCRIYATDMNAEALRCAKEGIYPAAVAEEGFRNYARAGGGSSLADYYTSAYGSVIFRSSLRDNVVFSQHNLAADCSFNEFHVILCRNVMIYFAKPLQQSVHNLLYESLAMLGFLGLGNKERVQFTPHEQDYVQIEGGERFYRRIQ